LIKEIIAEVKSGKEIVKETEDIIDDLQSKQAEKDD